MKKVIAASMIGNGLEWYDYALYANFAVLISTHFFPAEDPTVALIATFGVFAAGFLTRPLGAILFGYIGDTHGRRTALAASILLMAIPTACIGLLPGYASIGIAAPVLLTIIRLIQGVALGGEFGGSIVYLVEYAPRKYKNLVGSTTMISTILGILLGSLVATAFAKYMSEENFQSWGWRIPFIVGLFIGLIGLYIRTHLKESPAFAGVERTGHISKGPVSETFSAHWQQLLLAIGIYLAVTIPFYIQTVFMNSFMVKFLGFHISDALLINTICLLAMMLAVPVSAYFCDIYNRRKILATILIGYCILIFPLFLLLTSKIFVLALVSQLIFSVLIGFYVAPIPALLVDLFPTRVRYTGMALSCNLSATIFGGTAPGLLTWGITKFGNFYLVPYYVTVSALISLVCVFLKKRYIKG